MSEACPAVHPNIWMDTEPGKPAAGEPGPGEPIPGEPGPGELGPGEPGPEPGPGEHIAGEPGPGEPRLTGPGEAGPSTPTGLTTSPAQTAQAVSNPRKRALGEGGPLPSCADSPAGTSSSPSSKRSKDSHSLGQDLLVVKFGKMYNGCTFKTVRMHINSKAN